jgi:hypothetical protein
MSLLQSSETLEQYADRLERQQRRRELDYAHYNEQMTEIHYRKWQRVQELVVSWKNRDRIIS